MAAQTLKDRVARPEHFLLLIFPVSESRVVFDVMAKGGGGGGGGRRTSL